MRRWTVGPGCRRPRFPFFTPHKVFRVNTLLLGKLASLLPPNSAGAAPEILTGTSLGYDVKRQVFNTRFQFRPSAIVLVETPEQVSEIVKFANKFPADLVLRVRSGGHDHEGECSATDTLLIDFSKMNAVNVSWQDEVVDGRTKRQPIVSIGPGARFQHLKPILDKQDIGIAHGTCETVGIAGYTLGGGWGPWTRRYGMACERLIGATIVLGNGDIKVLGPEASDRDGAKLLWALRGGGGLSYGIVTELKFKAFELPEHLCSFNLFCEEAWPGRKALEILQCWENAVTGNQNPQLIGTNLKVEARHLPAGQAPDPEADLACTFNGYFAGTAQEAEDMITRYFGPLDPSKSDSLRLWVHRSPATGLTAAVRSEPWVFESWDRHVPSEVKRLKQLAAGRLPTALALKLEDDGPAPHKITSRLADASGWDDKGRAALICALQSSLVPPPEEMRMDGKPNDFAVTQYITLGAITGPFYATYDKSKEPPSAFPYKDRLFTIQFQAWWDQYLDSKGFPKAGLSEIGRSVLANRPWINRAEDWIEACRDYSIPNTSGAFISFKDSSVRTETYFAESYQALREVKQTCSMDKHLLFRSRKTII
jgi:hypothetical protein